jgi:hexokinase
MMMVKAALACAAAACTATAVLFTQRVHVRLQRKAAQRILEEFQAACDTPTECMLQVVDAMAIEMHKGLSSHSRSTLKMLPTFVDHLPLGDERGVYYAVDLGGTNFRVLRVHLGGLEGRVIEQEYEEVAIPSELMLGTSMELFDFVADELVSFAARKGNEGFSDPSGDQVREVGFTFSFPVNQTAVDSGTLMNWTKGFKVDDAIGTDVVAALQRSIDHKGHKMKVVALVNDTVGTLAAGRYWNKDVMVAVILGTGTNACYVEQGDAIRKLGADRLKCEQMVVNMEWGDFWSSHLPYTYADNALDKESLNPGKNRFEKLISGMYLGDIVRRVLLKMAQETNLFGFEAPHKLETTFSLQTPDMSKMHADDSSDLRIVAEVLQEVYGIENTSLAARKLVLDVCDIVCLRGARLAAAGIGGILKKIGKDDPPAEFMRRPWSVDSWEQYLHEFDGKALVYSGSRKIVVAMDGGLYEHYTKFRNYMQAAVVELLGEQSEKIVIELSKDGSGIGAALIAASHSEFVTM